MQEEKEEREEREGENGGCLHPAAAAAAARLRWCHMYFCLSLLLMFDLLSHESPVPSARKGGKKLGVIGVLMSKNRKSENMRCRLVWVWVSAVL